MKTCLDCIHHDRCDAIFDGLLSNRDNKLCDWFDDKVYYAKLPAYIGMKVWVPHVWYFTEVMTDLKEGHVSGLQQKANGSWKIRITRNGTVSDYTVEDFNKYCFLNKEDAEKYIEEQVASYEKTKI